MTESPTIGGTMTARLRLLAILAAITLVLAACGGGSDADSETAGDTGGADGSTSQDGPAGDGSGDGGPQDTDSGDNGSQNSDSGGDGGTSSGPPDLDPGDMPPAGEVNFAVDGQTFTIKADEMDYFICELDGDFINVRSESETLSLTVQYDPAIERGNASLVAEDDGVQYNSFFGGETGGGVAIEPPHLAYEAEFDSTQLDSLAVSDVGSGRVEVTCP